MVSVQNQEGDQILPNPRTDCLQEYDTHPAPRESLVSEVWLSAAAVKSIEDPQGLQQAKEATEVLDLESEKATNLADSCPENPQVW